MPRRKKLPPLEGLGKDPENKLMIQKIRPLTALSQSDLSLSEFKILDMYLARINTRNPDQRTVRLTKGQLEEALGVSRINKDDLKQRLKGLYQTIDLAYGNQKRIHLIGLFEEAEAEQDENGIWQVTLTCTQSAMKYIFNAENMGYFRYGLRSIVNLSSRYTYVLFMYLESNRYRKSWEVDLTELKQNLKCDQDELYQEFKFFNQRILKRCQAELHEKTECRFEYEPIKTGRRVTAIRFTLETLADSIAPPMPDQLTIADYEDLTQDPDDPLALLSAACDDEFCWEQMDVLLAAIATKDLPPHPDGLEFARYHYLQQQYAMLNVRAAGGKIKHRFEYLLKMIQNDKEGKTK